MILLLLPVSPLRQPTVADLGDRIPEPRISWQTPNPDFGNAPQTVAISIYRVAQWISH